MHARTHFPKSLDFDLLTAQFPPDSAFRLKTWGVRTCSLALNSFSVCLWRNLTLPAKSLFPQSNTSEIKLQTNQKDSNKSKAASYFSLNHASPSQLLVSIAISPAPLLFFTVLSHHFRLRPSSRVRPPHPPLVYGQGLLRTPPPDVNK